VQKRSVDDLVVKGGSTAPPLSLTSAAAVAALYLYLCSVDKEMRETRLTRFTSTILEFFIQTFEI
jgi:hypothetical protein